MTVADFIRSVVKYIVSSNPNEPGIRYGRYLDYLKTIREALPIDIYAFASDQRYFELNSPHSLHDAWLDSVVVRECRAQDRAFLGATEVIIKMLGQNHDRLIIMEYKDVYAYKIDGTRNVTDAPSGFHCGNTFHGDVFTHEVRLGEHSQIIHEIAFATDSTVLIECRSFTHREEMLEHEPQG